MIRPMVLYFCFQLLPGLTPKGFHEPVNLQPLNDQDQRAFQQGINSALSLRQMNTVGNDVTLHIVGGGGFQGRGESAGLIDDAPGTVC